MPTAKSTTSKTQKAIKAPSDCLVTIGYQDFVMPADKGLALIGLLKEGRPVSYGSTSDGVRTFIQDRPVGLSVEVLRRYRIVEQPGSTLH